MVFVSKLIAKFLDKILMKQPNHKFEFLASDELSTIYCNPQAQSAKRAMAITLQFKVH